jgi:hypothetical protein
MTYNFTSLSCWDAGSRVCHHCEFSHIQESSGLITNRGFGNMRALRNVTIILCTITVCGLDSYIIIFFAINRRSILSFLKNLCFMIVAFRDTKSVGNKCF